MARKGRTGQHLRNSGLYAGGNWPEYRYGTPRAYVHRPIYRGKKREHVIHRVLDVLGKWRKTPFENEGTCRAALRSALCLEGYEWQRSDAEAEQIVTEGLRLLGAVRPSYADGQREYSVSPDYCARCHSPLDDESIARGNRFCSVVCAKSAYEQRAYGESRTHYDLARNAYAIIRTDQAPAVECAHCGQSFKRMNIATDLKSGKRVYCSKACHDASMVIYADRECAVCRNTFRPRKETQLYCSKKCMGKANVKGPNRTCRHCGTPFHSYRISDPTKGFYCSRACSEADRGNITFDKTCAWCEKPFVAKAAKAMFCSPNCRGTSNDFTSGRWVPKRISPRVFDHTFRHRLGCTPMVFDAMFAEAA